MGQCRDTTLPLPLFFPLSFLSLIISFSLSSSKSAGDRSVVGNVPWLAHAGPLKPKGPETPSQGLAAPSYRCLCMTCEGYGSEWFPPSFPRVFGCFSRWPRLDNPPLGHSEQAPALGRDGSPEKLAGGRSLRSTTIF